MGFRTVIIKSRCKLEYSLNYLICRNLDGEKRVLINEIDVLMIQSTAVSITAALLSSLAEKNVKVILCDTKNNPQCELVNYNGTFDSYNKLINQIQFSNEAKNGVWKRIVEEKIINQSRNIRSINKERADLLEEYAKEVDFGDVTNREGHAAKVYFNTLFGASFSRDKSCNENMYLDYGYTILLSAINRTVKMLGFYLELGIHHIGKTNPFNMSCDLIEPLRPLVDSKVKNKKVNEENFKSVFIDMLNEKVIFSNSEMYLENALKTYVQSVFQALKNNDPSLIKFIQYEL